MGPSPSSRSGDRPEEERAPPTSVDLHTRAPGSPLPMGSSVDPEQQWGARPSPPAPRPASDVNGVREDDIADLLETPDTPRPAERGWDPALLVQQEVPSPAGADESVFPHQPDRDRPGPSLGARVLPRQLPRLEFQ